MLSSLQECPEEVGDAQDRGCPGWGCAGQGGDAQGICTFFSHLSWRPCLAEILCHGGPSALLVQAAMPGAAEELREEVPTVLLATVPIGPALLLWLCPGRWQGLAYSSCLPARE